MVGPAVTQSVLLMQVLLHNLFNCVYNCLQVEHHVSAKVDTRCVRTLHTDDTHTRMHTHTQLVNPSSIQDVGLALTSQDHLKPST